MHWLSLLSVALSNTHVRSLMLGLSGVVGTYLTQWLSGQDFGPSLTPLVAAGLPVLVNALQKWLTTATPSPAPVDLGGLNQLAKDHDQPDPPESPRLMRDEIPFSLLWLVPLLGLCCQAAQASPPKALQAALEQRFGATLPRHLEEAGSQSLMRAHGVIGTRHGAFLAARAWRPQREQPRDARHFSFARVPAGDSEFGGAARDSFSLPTRWRATRVKRKNSGADPHHASAAGPGSGRRG